MHVPTARSSADLKLNDHKTVVYYTGKAPNAWHRRGTLKRQETPTINPTDREPTHLTDQAPSTIERAARETHNTN